jgi:hypothetical protein
MEYNMEIVKDGGDTILEACIDWDGKTIEISIEHRKDHQGGTIDINFDEAKKLADYLNKLINEQI